MKVCFAYLSLILLFALIFKATQTQGRSPRKGFNRILYKNTRKRREKLKCTKDSDCEKHSSRRKHECFFTVLSNDDYVGFCRPLREKRTCKRHKRTKVRSCKRVRLHCKTTKECPKNHKCIQAMEANRGTCVYMPTKFLASLKVKFESKVVNLNSDSDISNGRNESTTIEEFLQMPYAREDPADDPFDKVLEDMHEKENTGRNSFLQMMNKLSDKSPLKVFEKKCRILTHSNTWSRICNFPNKRDKYANKKVKGGKVQITHIIVKNSQGRVLKGQHFSMGYLKKCTEGASKILEKGLGFKLDGKVKIVVSDEIFNARPKSTREFADRYRVQHFNALEMPSPRTELIAFWRQISPTTRGLSAFPGSSKPHSKGLEGVFDLNPMIKQTHWQCSATLAHELGHSLGLFHTHRTIEQTKIFEHELFSDLCVEGKCGEFSYRNEDAFDDLRGDFCSDTPPEPNLLNFNTDAFIKRLISNNIYYFRKKEIDESTYQRNQLEHTAYVNTGKVGDDLKAKIEFRLKQFFKQNGKHRCGSINYEKFPTNIMSYAWLGTEFTPQQRARAFCFAANVNSMKAIFPLE